MTAATHFPRYTWFIAFVLAYSLMMVSTPQKSWAEDVVIEIMGNQVKPIVIALPLPQTTANKPDTTWLNKFDTRLRSALTFHGAFAPLDHSAELADPTAITTLTAQTWRATGSDLLIRSKITQTSGKTAGLQSEAEVYLYDVVEAKSLLAKRFRTEDGRPEYLAEAIANDILELLLGIRAPFANKIAFQYRKPKQKWRELYTVDWTGANLQQISQNQKLILDPTFSKDRRSIFTIGYGTYMPTLLQFNLQPPTSTAYLKTPSSLHGVALMPNTQQAVVAWERRGNTDLYLIDLQTNTPTRLTSSAAADLSPTISPDGKTIVFVSDRRGNPYLFQLDIASQETRPLVLEGLYLAEPTYSPNGEYIAFIRQDPKLSGIEKKFASQADASGGYALWIMELKTGRLTRLTPRGYDNIESPAWGSDNRTIIYSRLQQGSYNLWRVDRLTLKTQQVTYLPGDARMPAW